MYVSNNPALCKSVNYVNLNFITFGHATVDPGWHGNVSSPLFSRLYYVLKGSFSIWNSVLDKITLEAGKWYLIPAGYSFDYSCSETMEHFYFHIKLCDFDGTDLLCDFKKPTQLEFEDFNPDFIKKCVKSGNLNEGLMLRQTVSNILLSFIEKNSISIHIKDYSSCLYKALVYIKQNLSMQLSISQIADDIFVSKSTLTKHFRKELSMSVNEYICNMVLAETEKLLVSSNISISDLSQKFGFSDQFYFSRKFKQKFGKSPREYRKDKML